MKSAIYIILFLTNIFLLTSQEAVISEYYNDSEFKNEWTEILVTKDFVNLNGYILRDNSERYNDGNYWQGGVIFSNNSLWKNLRIGTVIVINHRGTDAPDTDPSDGYIEVDAENPTYFNKYDWNGIASLSIQQYGDIIQLLNASQVNVHSLAHVKYSSQGDFYKIKGRKIAYVGNCNLGYSISVGNATKLEDYNLNITNQSGYDTGKSITLHSPGGTKGKANNNPKGGPVNYQFWQELRQPKFDNAFLKVKKIDSVAILTWNTVSQIPKTNDFGGYIILKSTDLKNTVCEPQDGREYTVNQKICSQTYVIGIVKGLNHNTFIDENPTCGVTSRYIIYAYNYGYDNKQWSVRDGRGVAYSDDISESNYEDLVLEEPIDLNLFSTFGTKFCSIDTTILFTNIPENIKSKYKYAWYFSREKGGSEVIVVDFSKPGITDSLKVYRPGYYRLEIKDETGCITYSDTLFIEIIDQPEAIIANSKDELFKNDTTIYYCGDLNYVIKSKSPFEDLKLITILKRGNITVSNSGEPYTVTVPGYYYYISRLEDCVDTSVVLFFTGKSYDMVANTNELNFTLVSTKPSIVDSLALTNNSNESYKFEVDDFTIKKPFKILNSFPIVVPQHSDMKIYIEFAPTIDGKFYDTLNIKGLCNSNLKIALNGLKLKSNASITINHKNVDFGNLVQCTYNQVDTNLTITNIGDEYIVMKEVNGIGDYFINPVINSDTLYPNQSFDIVVGSTSKKLGPLIGNFNIPWQSEGGIIDTLRFSAKAFIDIPKFIILEDTVNFGKMSGCEDYLIDSVTFVNTGIFELRLDDTDFISGLEILNKPVIVPPGDTTVVYLKYSSKSVGKIDKKNSFKVIPGCGLQDDFWVLAETIGGGFKVSMADTIDFGHFYSCQNVDTTIYLDINVTNIETNEDIIVTADLENDNFQLLDDLGKISGPLRVPIRFSKNSTGVYNSQIKFTFKPCSKERLLYLKANVINQDVSITDTVNFDSYEQGLSSTKKFTIKNFNPDPLIIDTIILPIGVTFVSTVNYPIIIQSEGVFTTDITLATLNLGNYLDRVQIYTLQPCDKIYNITLLGSVKPNTIPPGNFIAQFGIDNQIAPPKSEITIPLLINEDVYKYNDVELNSIKLNITYPFEALELKDIETIQAGLITREDDNFGNLTITLKDASNQLFNLTSSKICNLKFYVLDALPQTYKLTINSGEVLAIPSMNIETDDSSFVVVSKNCVNTIGYTFTDPVKLKYSIEKTNILISLLQPTDDKYILKLYDNTGRVINEVFDGKQGRGDHFKSINLSDFYSGMYYLVLYYPNNVITKQISIIK